MQTLLASRARSRRSGQIAAATGLSTATVQREWRMARAWLRRELDVD